MEEFDDRLKEKAFHAMTVLYKALVMEVKSDNYEEDFMVMASALCMAILHLRNHAMGEEDWAAFNEAIFNFLQQSLPSEDSEE